MATVNDFGWGRMGPIPKELKLVVAIVDYDGETALTPPPGAATTPNDPTGLVGAIADRIFGSAAGARTVRNWWKACFDSELMPFLSAVPVIGPIILPLGVSTWEEAPRVEVIKTRVLAALTGYAPDLAWYDKDKNGFLQLRDEINVLVLDNYTEVGGVNRDYGPGQANLSIKGLQGSIAAVGWKAPLMTIGHELMHLFGAIDIYGASEGLNFRYSAMSSGPSTPWESSLWSPDPFHRLQMGVSAPRIRDMTVAGGASIRAVSDQDRSEQSALLLYSSQRGHSDYFLIELRTQDGMDADVFPGWAVWQVTLNAAGNAREDLPSKTVADGFDSGVNMLGKPDHARGSSTPWDPYDVVSLQWADGTSAGIDVAFAPDDDGRSGQVAWGPTGEVFKLEKFPGFLRPVPEVIPAPKEPAPM